MPLELQPRPIADHLSLARPGSDNAGALVIGLINNMPDSALEGTETQFRALLRAACGPMDVRLRLSSMPEVPRGPAAQARIAEHYWPLDRLLADAPDAIIVTGTEPKAPALSDEPYWARLVDLIEYADTHLISSVWSCLAAHAAALHLDGIARQRLTAKRFGVFDQRVLIEHALTTDLGPEIRIPHSRWNNLPLETLVAADYQVLTESALGDADCFVKQRRSLLVFFQGHPEYEERTLLKEFQRDVARFVSGEYQDYPYVPPGYFDAEAQALLAEFERKLRADEFDEPMASFPFAPLASSIQPTWLEPAAQIYGNWLAYIASQKADAASKSHFSAASASPRARSTVPSPKPR